MTNDFQKHCQVCGSPLFKLETKEQYDSFACTKSYKSNYNKPTNDYWLSISHYFYFNLREDERENDIVFRVEEYNIWFIGDEADGNYLTIQRDNEPIKYFLSESCPDLFSVEKIQNYLIIS